MPVTQSQIDELNAKIAAGEQVISHGDKMVRYGSIADLITARDNLINQMAAETAASSGVRRNRQTRLYHAGRGN